MEGISVVIPNYNGRYLLEVILPPLFLALENAKLPYEVILSDDASTDDSLDYVRTHYPDIILIEKKINEGFSPTINRGIFIAKYDYVLLLNSDVKLTENYFSGLPAYFESEDTFGVMGRIVGWDDDIIQDGGKFPSFHGAKIKTTGNYIPMKPVEGDRNYSMYLSGANAFVSRKKLCEMGGFDEIFAPFYVEDYELSLRAWRLGYKCYYDHFAVCRHKVSVSIKTKNSKDYINAIYYRNKMFLHAMHLEGSNRVLWYLQLIPETLIRLFTLRFYYFASLLYFFRNSNRMKRSTESFRSLAKGRNLLSVNEVVEIIKNSLKDTPIRRF